jgi:acetyltransferase
MAEFGYFQTIQHKAERRVAADKESVAQLIRSKLRDTDHYKMTEKEARSLLADYGFPLLRSRLLRSIDDIESAAEDVMFPVAMKISSPDIIHKLDANGVLLDIDSVAQARTAYETLITNAKAFDPHAKIDGVLMEKMARKGMEVILGASRDPRFGPVCMFGLGGTLVEVLKDVTFRVAPMWEISAETMIQSIKAYRVLTGIRGMPPSDIPAIKDCILRLSQLVSDHPEIDELDINPLIVYPEKEGCVVADTRILLSALPKRTSQIDEL